MTMTDKLTPKSMKDQYDHQYNLFCRKNHDYGNSFEKSLDTFGLVAGIVRMNDKFERLVSLNDPNKDAQIASESLVDTLEDLSNYAAMAACWLKGKKKADWKELRMKSLDGNIESIIKNADAIVDNMKGESKIHSKDVLAAMNIETGKIEFHPNFTKAIFKGPKEKNDNVDLYWSNKLNDNMAVGGDIKIEDESIFHEREGWEEEMKFVKNTDSIRLMVMTMKGKLKTLNEVKENDWWTSHDRTWVFNARTRELFRIPNFQFPGRKELEERDGKEH